MKSSAKPNMSNNDGLFENRIWMNTQEAATYLGITENTLRNLTSNGTIVYYKLGNRNRYLKTDLDELLFSNKRGGYHGN